MSIFIPIMSELIKMSTDLHWSSKLYLTLSPTFVPVKNWIDWNQWHPNVILAFIPVKPLMIKNIKHMIQIQFYILFCHIYEYYELYYEVTFATFANHLLEEIFVFIILKNLHVEYVSYTISCIQKHLHNQTFPMTVIVPLRNFESPCKEKVINMMNACMTDQYFHDNIAFLNRCLCLLIIAAIEYIKPVL